MKTMISMYCKMTKNHLILPKAEWNYHKRMKIIGCWLYNEVINCCRGNKFTPLGPKWPQQTSKASESTMCQTRGMKMNFTLQKSTLKKNKNIMRENMKRKADSNHEDKFPKSKFVVLMLVSLFFSHGCGNFDKPVKKTS